MEKVWDKQYMLQTAHNEMGISRLVKNKKYSKLGYNYFVKYSKPYLSFDYNDTMRKIAYILKRFPVKPKFVIFSSISLNFCINQQITSTTYILEIEKDYIDTVFDLLKNSFKNVVLKCPSEKDKIAYWKPNAIYIYPLFSRSPINANGTFSLEKLVVDLLFSHKLSNLYSGNDIKEAIDTLFRKYHVNYMTLFAYAKRRNKEKELYSIINPYMPDVIKEAVRK